MCIMRHILTYNVLITLMCLVLVKCNESSNGDEYSVHDQGFMGSSRSRIDFVQSNSTISGGSHTSSHGVHKKQRRGQRLKNNKNGN